MGWRGGIAAQTMGPRDIPWESHVPDLDVTVGWNRQVDIPWEYNVYQWDGVDRGIAVQATCIGLCMGHSLNIPCVYTG